MSYKILFPANYFSEVYYDGTWTKSWSQPGSEYVYRDASSRVRIVYEDAHDIGWGLARDDQAMEAGIDIYEVDAQNFAKGLIEKLTPHMNLHELRLVTAEFNRHLAEEEAKRLEMIRMFQEERDLKKNKKP